MLKKSGLIAVGSLALSAASSFAISFNTSVGSQPSNVGTITLSQVNSTTVDVLFQFSASNYGFLNTGGQHTPFTFTLAGVETGVSASFLQPSGGTYGSQPYTFTLNLADSDNTPYGTFGIGIDILPDGGGNQGSGNAYYGTLEFNLIRTGGLLVTDFTTNSLGYYFGADLTDGQNTGAQGWKTPGGTPGTNDFKVPDAGSTVILLGAALTGLGMMSRRFKK